MNNTNRVCLTLRPVGSQMSLFPILKLLLLLFTTFCLGETLDPSLNVTNYSFVFVHNCHYLFLATGKLLVKCGAHVVTLPPTTTSSTTTMSSTTVSQYVSVPVTVGARPSTPKATPYNHVTSSEPSVEKSTGKKISDFLRTYSVYYTCV